MTSEMAYRLASLWKGEVHERSGVVTVVVVEFDGSVLAYTDPYSWVVYRDWDSFVWRSSRIASCHPAGVQIHEDVTSRSQYNTCETLGGPVRGDGVQPVAELPGPEAAGDPRRLPPVSHGTHSNGVAR